ncbi:MAG: sugar phosphate isomerase/epimerase [Gemmatales bacterium]|nr:sugar phosphate isomerase/epimerase [Gemmatales bacterium]MCS7161606.1 sugar phosphate isomerase/epimerase [Gemmatales bacterium]MDW8176809.1 sugar phosphate isomerase/epimerase [Gemmatales bacterium]
MELACSTLAFTRYSLEEALQSMVDLGFNRAEVAILPHSPHLTAEQVCQNPPGTLERLRSVSGISIAAFLLELGDMSLRVWQEQFPEVCRLANLMGIVTVTVAAGPRGSDWSQEVHRLRQLVGWAFSYGVVVCVETRMGTLTESPESAIELCRCVPGLRLTFDPSHYLCRGVSEKAWEALYPYVHHVHLRDSGTSPDKFQVRTGQGQMPFGRILQQLRRQDYRGVLTIEMSDNPAPSYPLEPELRTLRLLLAGMI